VLRANPYWAGAKPKLAEIDFKVISDLSLQIEAMRGGQIDVMYPPFVPDLLPLKTAPGVTYEQGPVYALEHLLFREGSAKAGPGVTKGSSNVLLRAPWMRRAIALALDRRAMIQGVYGQLAGGLEPTDDLLFFSTEAGYRHDFPGYHPAQALAILKAHCSGGPSVPDPATTKVWQCAGLPATFGYTWPLNAMARTTIEQIAKADLRAVGVAVVDEPLGSNVVFGSNGINGGGYDLAEYADFTSGDPGDWYDLYRCFGTQNFTGYCRHALDSLLAAANSELDPQKRLALFEHADAILASDIPIMPLFQKLEVIVRKSNLLGVELNPGGDGPFWNVQDWRWK
jgi:peptide/nickel transport system substrate-binding protein